MQVFLYGVLVFVCVLTIFTVLLQAGKGAGAGFSMGGGMAQTMFGGSGGKNFFMKFTIGLAVAFMVICLVLAQMATKTTGNQYTGGFG